MLDPSHQLAVTTATTALASPSAPTSRRQQQCQEVDDTAIISPSNSSWRLHPLPMWEANNEHPHVHHADPGPPLSENRPSLEPVHQQYSIVSVLSPCDNGDNTPMFALVDRQQPCDVVTLPQQVAAGCSANKSVSSGSGPTAVANNTSEHSTSSIPSGLQSIYALASGHRDDGCNTPKMSPKILKRAPVSVNKIIHRHNHRRASAANLMPRDDGTVFPPSEYSSDHYQQQYNNEWRHTAAVHELPIPCLNQFKGRPPSSSKNEQETLGVDVLLQHSGGASSTTLNEPGKEEMSCEEERQLLLEHLEASRDFNEFDI